MKATANAMEVIVNQRFVWWTYVALSCKEELRGARFTFRNKLSSKGNTKIIDSRIFASNARGDSLCNCNRVAILLWDGYQSYAEIKELIRENSKEFHIVFELWVVGDLDDIANESKLKTCYLFDQTPTNYDFNWLRSRENTQRFGFQSVWQYLLVRYRDYLISGKVGVQLIRQKKIISYKSTNFLFCGQSGEETLHAHLGTSTSNRARERFKPESEGDVCALILSSIRYLEHIDGSWKKTIVARALIRYLAIWCLKQESRDVFLNIFPEPNINAYQARVLFSKHVFLDFGGINGGEVIYPRTADLGLFGRRIAKLDTDALVTKIHTTHAANCTDAHALLMAIKSEVITMLSSARQEV